MTRASTPPTWTASSWQEGLRRHFGTGTHRPTARSAIRTDVQKQIIINRSSVDTRIGLIEDGTLAEIHVETSGEPSSMGNVFRGRVVRVLPGIQAAFVDIGLEKAAFMHVSDFWEGPEEAEPDDDLGLAGEPAPTAEASETEADPIEIPDLDEFETDAEPAENPAPGVSEDEDSEPPAPRRSGRRSTIEPPPIDQLLSAGQEVLVQVSKEPMGTKGARVTSHISLPGRYIVFMPTSDHIGVSRRIEATKERKRLKKIVSEKRGDSKGGYIVRTACEGLTKREIETDMGFLSRLWASIEKKADESPSPSLIHEDLDLVLRAVRDLMTNDVQEIVVDDPADYERISNFIETALEPEIESRLRLYEGLDPLFDNLGIENQVKRALDRRVWLKSGGYLIMDQTEALTTIDVNTGRFVGKTTHEETVVKTNLEAATVVIDQLRLRNIGGIIVIDFIDMEKSANRKKVSAALEAAVKRDKARTNILKISELGLVQMTRKRTRENVRQILTTPCSVCQGEGRQLSPEAVAGEILRAAHRKAATISDPSKIVIRGSAEITGLLRAAIENRPATVLESRGFTLSIHGEPDFDRDRFEIEVGTAPRRRRRGGRRKRRQSAKTTKAGSSENGNTEPGTGAGGAQATGD